MVQWTVRGHTCLALLCCGFRSGLWPMLYIIPPFSLTFSLTLIKWHKSHYLSVPIFITTGHTGVMLGAKLSARSSHLEINVNTVIWVNRHSCTITRHRYTADIIRREATNAPSFENGSREATLYSITLHSPPPTASYFPSFQSISCIANGLVQTQFLFTPHNPKQSKHNQQDMQSKTAAASQCMQINWKSLCCHFSWVQFD